MPESRRLNSCESRVSDSGDGNVEVEVAICHEGQGVKISPIFFSGGLGNEVVCSKNGFVVNCSHMKKSAEGFGLASGS